VNDHHTKYVNNRVLKLQIGFLLNEGVGTSRDTDFDIPNLLVDNDMLLDYFKGKLHLSRNSRGVLVQGTFEAGLHGECVRCLDETAVAVTLDLEELFVYPAEPGADYTVPESGVLDLASLIREEVIVQTPITVLCRPKCAGLCPECGHNRNTGPCGCDTDAIDPRFAALKELKDRLNES
jgi:uncharacterized protein